MALINENYLKLKAGYLFPEIGRRVKNFIEANPDKKIIKLGIGDVTKPLNPTVIEAFHRGVDEMGDPASFKGYGPEGGYPFLRELIADNDFKGLSISPDEVFISDGAKCDSGNIQEIFSTDARIAVADPVYPVYVDTNVMAGRSGAGDDNGMYDGIIYMPCLEKNGFAPELPAEKPDIIYLCYPNNPTGTTISKADLGKWVDYARDNKAVILYDAAYEAFISSPDLPHSIYEIEGAHEVAVELRSLSKTAGFTGTRLAYTTIPKTVMGYDRSGEAHSLHKLWFRRQCTKFNEVSYPVQKAASAIFSEQGSMEVKEVIAYYMKNAALIREKLSEYGFTVYGGTDAPYVWIKTKENMSSWDFFDLLLNEVNVVGTPGSGFGPSGEGFFRLSAFGEYNNVVEAMDRIKKAGI